MQRIERYGVLAFLFLVITAIVVPMWGGDEEDSRADNGAAAMGEAPATAQPLVAHGGPKRVDGGLDVSPRAATAKVAPRTGAGALRFGEPAATREAQQPRAAEQQPALAAGDARDAGAFERQQQRRPRRTAPRNAEAEPAAAAPQVATPAQPQRQQPAAREPEPRRAAGPTPARAPAAAEPLAPAAERVAASTEPLRIGRAEAGAVRAVPATYVVAPGDTLSEIAEKTLGSSKRWREIQAVNGDVDPARLFVGQRLKLPGDQAVSDRVRPGDVASAQPPRQAPPTPAAKAGERTYRVRPGDVLSVIAQNELGSSKRWKEIVALNPGLDARRLYVGKELVLPAGGAPTRTMLASNEPASSGSSRAAEEGRYRVR